MQALITTTLSLMLSLIPLVFTTVSYELFEFPKFLLLISGTIIISVGWVITAWHKRSFSLIPKSSTKTKKYLHYSVLAVLATQLLSTLFSIDPHTSWWGYYSRFHQGLLTTICYTIIYFASLNFLDKKSVQKIIKISISTSFLISLYAIAQRLGIDKNLWIQDVVHRPFSTLGQPNWLAAYLLPNLFLTLYFSSSKNSKLSQIISALAYSTIFTAILLTRSRSGLIALAASYLAYWLLLLRNLSLKRVIYRFALYLSLSLTLTLIIGSAYTPSLSELISRSNSTTSPTTPTGTQLESGGTESGDIRKIVWSGALELVKDHPFLGTGPETFAYSYYWTRPIEHNYVSEWDFLYNKAHNEYLNFAANTGLIGLAAYLAFHYFIAAQSLQVPSSKTKKAKQQNRELIIFLPALLASIISFTITNFFGFSVIPVYLLTIILAALPSPLTQSPIKNDSLPLSPILYIIVAISLLTFPVRFFFADLNFNKGKNALAISKLVESEKYLTQAISLWPSETLYHTTLAETYAQLTVINQSPHYLDLTLRELEWSHSHNQWHLNYFKSRTKTYLSLAQLDPTWNTYAARELEEARELAPTDPKLAYNLGLIYSRLPSETNQTHLDDAITQMQDAISLKHDYYQPYYALTLLYESTGQDELIPDLINQAKEYIDPLPEQLSSKLNSI